MSTGSRHILGRRACGKVLQPCFIHHAVALEPEMGSQPIPIQRQTSWTSCPESPSTSWALRKDEHGHVFDIEDDDDLNSCLTPAAALDGDIQSAPDDVLDLARLALTNSSAALYIQRPREKLQPPRRILKQPLPAEPLMKPTLANRMPPKIDLPPASPASAISNSSHSSSGVSMMSSTPPPPPTPMYIQVGFHVGSPAPGDPTLQAVLGRDPISEAHRRRTQLSSSGSSWDSSSRWDHRTRSR